MSVLSRLHWILWRRRRSGDPGMRLNAHITSKCDASSRFGKGVMLAVGVEVFESTIGDMSYLSRASRVALSDVGRFCSIGPNTNIGGLGIHPKHLLSTHPLFYSERYDNLRGNRSKLDIVENVRTRVGSDVWIGANALILDGIVVEDGAIVAAGAVVNRDVAPFEIVGGVPAKTIGYRFPEHIRDELLGIRWWDVDFESILSIAKLVADGSLAVSDIDILKEKIESLKNK